MNILIRVLTLFITIALTACTGATTSQIASGPLVTAPPSQLGTLPNQPPIQTATPAAADVSSFIDSGATGLLSEKDKAQAANAQFYALQFGRPGAPRQWQGNAGVTGNVSVGPYVRVNSLDCREFTHNVQISGKSYGRKGTSCREIDGRWAVVDSAPVT